MHFQITRYADVGVPGAGIPGVEFYGWVLVKSDGPVCRSARNLTTEKEARSDIAQAKKTMKGAMRAKVLSP